MKKFIGLTGGIAAGKSAVVKILQNLNIRVIDCDKLAREAVQPGSGCLGEIAALFGLAVLNQDGSLNRQIMAKQVFAEPKKRLALEKIIHPFVEQRMLAEMQDGFSRGEQLVVADVPLLFEVGWQQRFDEIWLVVCDDRTRINRMIDRDGIDAAAASKRLAAQWPQSDKLAVADQIIDNNATFADLETRVRLLVSQNKQ
ncbi:MAG: dephospho-CoA kinase [Bacillota bacterium]